MGELDMSERDQADERRGAEKHFARYAELELERRRDSEAVFDESEFQEAVELVLHRLEAAAEETQQ
jgi:hypothetical protein